MPENKSQHYVPRCHLRPFCADADGAAINVFNVSRRSAIQGAPARGQCARDYFYGEDRVIEKALQGPEGKYAANLRQAVDDPHSLSKRQLNELRDFALLQTFRSHGYIEKLLSMAAEHDTDLATAGPDLPAPKPMLKGFRGAMLMALSHYSRMPVIVQDLDTCLIISAARLDLITSDDPAIHTNRYHFQQVRSSAFGFSNSGAMLFLPLSPKLAFMAFDPFVYKVPGRVGNAVVLTHDDDIADLNALQFLHARQNLYFGDWEKREAVAEGFARHADGRPRVWHKFRYFEKVDEDGAVERFERVAEMKLAPGREFLTSFSTIHVRPARWPRVLAYKLKPQVVDTRSGGGIVRPNHPILKQRFGQSVEQPPEG